MDIQLLETLLAVERTRSFTATAQELFCTQAAVSMRIKKLESVLGTPLFIRHSRSVELNREGAIFLPYARQMYNTWQSANEHLLQSRLMEQSELHIACSSTPGTYIIPSVIYLFRQKYPYITVLSHVQYTKSAIEAVKGGTAVLGIISQPAKVAGTELLCEPLIDDPLVLVVHPNHPWAASSGVSLRRLSEEAFIISNPNTSLIKYLETVGSFAIDRSKLYVAGNLEAIKRSIYSQQGVSVMSRYAVRQELELGLLREVPVLETTPLTRKVYFICRSGSELSLSAQFFLDFAKQAAGSGLLNTL